MTVDDRIEPSNALQSILVHRRFFDFFFPGDGVGQSCGERMTAIVPTVDHRPPRFNAIVQVEWLEIFAARGKKRDDATRNDETDQRHDDRPIRVLVRLWGNGWVGGKIILS